MMKPTMVALAWYRFSASTGKKGATMLIKALLHHKEIK